jgi:hypothetical protein
MVNAAPELSRRLQMQTTGVSAFCFRQPLSSLSSKIESELLSLLAVGRESSGTKYRVLEDEFGFGWVIIKHSDFQTLVTTIYLAALTFMEHKLSDQLLAATFPFSFNNIEIQWIYNFKRKQFYPFVPVDENDRDSILEFDLSSKVEEILPIESQLEHWYGIWGAPLSVI